MKPLTKEQSEKLFDLIDKEGMCPGLLFGDSCHPDACPHKGHSDSGGEECQGCVREAISELRWADRPEDRYERMQ